MAVLLPQELYDTIIDCLRGDTEALEACSLTSHGWTSRARRYLFEKVWLRRRRDTLLFLRALESSAKSGSRIGDYVLDLTLPCMTLKGNSSRNSRSLLIRYALIAELLRYLPHTERLTMYGFDWKAVELAASLGPLRYPGSANLHEADPVGPHPQADLRLLAPSLPSLPCLKCLRLSDSMFQQVKCGEAMARCLAAFPQLHSLEFQFSRMATTRGFTVLSEDTARPLVHIRELKLDSGTWHHSPALDWLSSRWVFLDLRKLEIYLDCPRTSRLAEFLAGSGCDSLEELTFSGSHEQVPQDLDLSRYRRLRSLRLRMSSLSALRILPIAQLLSSYSRNGLREIQINLRIIHFGHEIEWGPPSEWDAFIASLKALSRRCPGLSITLGWYLDSLCSAEGNMPAAQWLRDRFLPLSTASDMDIALVVNEVRRFDSPEAVKLVETSAEHDVVES